jgi:hypothetical protein
MERDALLAAGDENLASTLRHYARTAPGAAVEDDGGLLLVSLSRTWPGPYHNGAIRLDPRLRPAEVLSRAEAFFSGRSPGYCVWIADHADTDLEEAAVSAGYAPISETGTPRMALSEPLEAGVPAHGVTLCEVADETARCDFVAVTVEAYKDSHLPREAIDAQLGTLEALCTEHVRAVVARLDGVPLSAAMTVASGEVAGIQTVGTVPEARAQGLGELCTRWAVRAGFELGAGAIVLEASAQGEPLYLRLGFVEVSRYRWCFGPPARTVPGTPGRPGRPGGSS